MVGSAGKEGVSHPLGPSLMTSGGAVSGKRKRNGEHMGCWLAQSVEHRTLDLGAVSSSPALSVEITQKNFFKVK